MIVFRIYISNYGINSTSDSYDSMIRWLIPEAFDVIPNRGGPLGFDNTVTLHSKPASKQDLSEIKCTSSGNSNMLIAN